jgi:hypothetical protein
MFDFMITKLYNISPTRSRHFNLRERFETVPYDIWREVCRLVSLRLILNCAKTANYVCLYVPIN